MEDMDIKWEAFIKQFVTYEGYETVLEGLETTLIIAVCGLLIGILLGTILAVTKVIPKNNIVAKFFSALTDIYVGLFRGTPIVVQLLLAYYVLMPLLDIRLDAMYVAIIAFGLNSGAYVSEIMRAGINSVDKGQLEAGRSLGMSYTQSMVKIVIPQAIKNIFPTLGNEFISLVKETSVVSFIAVVDLTKAFKDIGAANYEFIIPYLMLALFYLVIVGIITVVINLGEKALAKSGRTMKKKSLVEKWGLRKNGGQA